MVKYYLQLIYKGKVVYRKESLKPLSITDVVLEDGVIENGKELVMNREPEL